MNELLFFGGTTIIIGLSYYMGRESGLKFNFKEHMKDLLMSMTVSKMTSDYFDRRAINETKQYLKTLGVKNVKNKFIIVPKRPTSEDIDNIVR